MRVGGRAEWLLEPKSPDELCRALVAAREQGFEVRMLGGGANLIVQDGVLPGVVIATDCLDRVFRPEIEATDDPFREEVAISRVAPASRTEDPRLVAWCGASLPGLVRKASDLGWSGLEGLVGVPGHLGGGVMMNAGGRWGDLWDVIESVRVLTLDGEVRDLARADCDPQYRSGNLGDVVVIAAELRLTPDNTHAVKERAKEFLLEKNRVQPVTESSSGCIFKNPDPELSDGRSAGKLIDDLGLKGLSRGAAVVSERHGNFIVNRGGASAADVLGLIDDLRERVADATGIELSIEVRRWLAEPRS
jgi:UDP-N-acetylmuramate dehydrogenase